MASAIRPLTRIQIGKESTRGTAVAATRRLVVSSAAYRRQETFETFEDAVVGSGVLARTSRAPLLTRTHTELELTLPLSFEDVLLPLLSGVQGGVTGSGAGTDKTWTFTPSAAGDPAPDTYTVEFVESDGTNHAEMECPFAFTTAFEVTGGVERVPELRVTMAARRTVDSTMTPSLAVPSVNHAANLLWTVYVDDSWSALGTTQVLGQVYAFTYRWEWLRPQYYLDGRQDLDFSTYVYERRMADLTLDVVVDAAATGLIQAEEAKKTAGTLRFVQLKLLGGAIGAGNYTVQIDGAYYHLDDSMAEAGSDRDGNLVRRIHLQSAYDPTSGNDARFVVVNGLSAYP